MEPNRTPGRWRFVDAADLTNDSVGFDSLEVRSSSADENLGTVQGFIVDADRGQLHYVVVDSGGWFSSGSYLVPPAYTRVDAEEQVLWTDATRDSISRFAHFDPSQYDTLSDDQLWTIERRIIEAYGGDPGVIAPSASWDREQWDGFRQPDWWSPTYLEEHRESTRPPVRDTAHDTTGVAGWPEPASERAQPGDVLGIERGGETTTLGETAEDEDKRRTSSERAYESIRDEDERERARRRTD